MAKITLDNMTTPYTTQLNANFQDIATELNNKVLYRDNPVGVKGIGEPVMGCAAAAVLCAISDALDGHVFNRTPVSADMIINHVAGLPPSTRAMRTNSF